MPFAHNSPGTKLLYLHHNIFTIDRTAMAMAMAMAT